MKEELIKRIVESNDLQDIPILHIVRVIIAMEDEINAERNKKCTPER